MASPLVDRNDPVVAVPVSVGYGRALAVLGLISWLGPFSLDAYGPAFPAIAEDLDVPISLVQLTLTGLVFGLAVGHLVAGPLTDVYGRRRPLVVGLVLYLGATVLCAVSPGIWFLVVARVLQGLTVAVALVVGKAAARDLYAGPRLARFFSHLAAVLPVAPALGPAMGAVLLGLFGWRAVFVMVAVLGAITLAVVVAVLPETAPPRPLGSVAGQLASAVRGMGGLTADPGFRLCVIVFALASGVGLTFLAGAPFVLQDDYGISAQQYSLLFTANAASLVLAAQVNSLLLRVTSPGRIVVYSLAAQGVTAAALTAALLAGAPVGWIVAALIGVVFFHGFLMPNLVSIGMNRAQQHPGGAAALLGVSQYLVGGAVAPLVGAFGIDVGLAMGATMIGLAVVALLVHLRGERVRAAAGEAGG